jgi:hypothetical protein
LIQFDRSDTIGGSAVVGNPHWSGTYGVNVDYVALTHCSVEAIDLVDIKVRL